MKCLKSTTTGAPISSSGTGSRRSVYFKQAIKVLPDDGPSRIYVEKCEEYMKTPPPRGWDGVFVLKSK